MDRGPLAGVLVLALAAAPAGSAAATVSGPHEIVDSRLSTQRPASPAGMYYSARYHAANDPSGDPPYMRRMVSYNPSGIRLDTSVPDRCAASDLELAVRPDACPSGSHIGGGTADGRFLGFPPTRLDVDVYNNTGQQIVVARSPGFATVARGTIHPDGAVDFSSPTCFPALNPPGCPVDNTVQLGSTIDIPPLVRSGRSYLVTPPTCPRSRVWQTPIRFWWADGTVDTVVVEHPCKRRVRAHGRTPRA